MMRIKTDFSGLAAIFLIFTDLTPPSAGRRSNQLFTKAKPKIILDH